MKMTIEEVKKNIATKYGYSNFNALLKNYWASERYVNEAMELFAEAQVKNFASSAMVSHSFTNKRVLVTIEQREKTYIIMINIYQE